MPNIREFPPETAPPRAADAGEFSQAETRARGQAHVAYQRLVGITRVFSAIDLMNPLSNHRHFAQLYSCTTRQWLTQLPKDPDRLFAYLVIPPFLALYERHVCAALDAPKNHIARHWRGYHRLARRRALTPGQRLRLVVRAALAHTHFDLGQVIREVERGFEDSFARPGSAPRRVMFGQTASRAFSDTAVEFFGAESPGDGPSDFGAAGAGPVPTMTRPLWLPTLQLLRLSGYYHARLGGGP